VQAKLTLRLEEQLIRRAKRFAWRSGNSLSAMVANLFSLLDEPDAEGEEVTAAVRSLSGALRGTRLGERDYRRHLRQRHR
jgi:hypothetical protein